MTTVRKNFPCLRKEELKVIVPEHEEEMYTKTTETFG